MESSEQAAPRSAATRRAVDSIILGGYRVGSVAAQLVPGIATGAVVAPLGLGANFASAERRALVMRNLQRVDPSLRGLALRRAAQQAFDSYARYYLESFRLPSLSDRVVEEGMTTDGYEEYMLPGLAQGNGVIIALPHLGGWEWAGRWIAGRGHPISVVVERIEPPGLFEWFAKLRSDLGMNIIPLGPGAASEVLGALKRNEVVCLLSDRDLQRSGVEVEFFGERTTLPAGPATLGLRTGAPILPTAVYFSSRTGHHHFGWVRPPVEAIRTEGSMRADVTRVTQALAVELEIMIRRAPTQWHMFQPNWPSDPGYSELDPQQK
jgi:lauroyl/myristoyl acyltransferase